MSQPVNLETDSRFPSGKWVGFFVDKRMPGKQEMELTLLFANGKMTGDGRDRVGTFTFNGKYDLNDGKCEWVKKYVNAHAVDYRGFNEGKGIWGTWEMHWEGAVFTGGFHIWPDGMADPTQPASEEEADTPYEIDTNESGERELELAPI
ncbi:MAG: hypothetical protein EXS09_02025 [Gemmataceae bacterium]|nr:hypothetical protein [Gemmataceae bacterium]